MDSEGKQGDADPSPVGRLPLRLGLEQSGIISNASPATISTSSDGAITRWKRGQMLGKGGFGSVYLALNLDNGKLFAVKQIEDFDDTPAGKQDLSALENEIKTLQQCKHENIVQYLGYERSETSISIFLEYVSGGSICGLLERFSMLEESVVRVYTRQLLLGLEYLHLNGVAHRDIKGGNVLVAHDGTVKLADFGASKRIWSSSSRSARYSGVAYGIKGTAMWMAPEVIREDQSERMWKKADMWSVGCTVVEMLTGKPPWHQFSNPVTAMYHIACGQSTPEIPKGLSAHGQQFLEACFRQDPKERPDASTILFFPFVARAGERARGAEMAIETYVAPLATSRSVSTVQHGPESEAIRLRREWRLAQAQRGSMANKQDVRSQNPSQSRSKRRNRGREAKHFGDDDDSDDNDDESMPVKLDLKLVHSGRSEEDERVELHLPSKFYIETSPRQHELHFAHLDEVSEEETMASAKTTSSCSSSSSHYSYDGSPSEMSQFISSKPYKLPKLKVKGSQGRKKSKSKSKSAAKGNLVASQVGVAKESGGVSKHRAVRVISDPFEMVQDAMNSLSLGRGHDLSPAEYGLAELGNSYDSSDTEMISHHPLSLSSRSTGSSRSSCTGRQNAVPPLKAPSSGASLPKSARWSRSTESPSHPRNILVGSTASNNNDKSNDSDNNNNTYGYGSNAPSTPDYLGTPGSRTPKWEKHKYAPILPMGEGDMVIHAASRLGKSKSSKRNSTTPGASATFSHHQPPPAIDARNPLTRTTSQETGNEPIRRRERLTASYDARRSGRPWGLSPAIAAARASLASDAVSRTRKEWSKTPPLRQYNTSNYIMHK